MATFVASKAIEITKIDDAEAAAKKANANPTPANKAAAAEAALIAGQAIARTKTNKWKMAAGSAAETARANPTRETKVAAASAAVSSARASYEEAKLVHDSNRSSATRQAMDKAGQALELAEISFTAVKAELRKLEV